MKLRCYCCGESIGSTFALVTMSLPDMAVDRVFIFLPDHVERVEEGTSLMVMVQPCD